jgi:hypothetical protein
LTLADQIASNVHTARLLATVLNTRLETTLQHLTMYADSIDGFPTTASGSDSGPGTRNIETSSTERAVLNRSESDNDGQWDRRPIAALHEGADLANTLLRTSRMLLAWCDTHNTTRISASELDTLRCINWRREERTSCGNFATPRRHNNQTIDDGRCLKCGALNDELEDIRRTESNERRLRRYTSGQSPQVDHA